jgi:hypothetical protein
MWRTGLQVAAEAPSRGDAYFRARKIRELATIVCDVTVPGGKGDQMRAGKLLEEIALLAGSAS